MAAGMAASMLVLAACGGADSDGVDPSTAPRSRAMTAWTPGPGDSCTREVHDQYATVGPDGKLYPTWHPTVDPGTGCSFGHDHGRDPSGSDLRGDVGDVPFGYANEQLELVDPANPRHEDHVGHKLEWENDLELEARGAGSQLIRIRCDVLTKLHQGTHSKDAFANNLHELVYHLRCGNGTEMHVTLMSAIGNPGEFRRSCDRGVTIQAGPAVPANSPNGGGFRAIPERFCLEQEVLVGAGENSNFFALNETWETSNSIRTAEGRELAFFNPYYQVRNPSRYHHPTIHPTVGRPIDICYETEPNGDRATGGPCAEATDNGQVAGVTYDDPRSTFDGARRVVDINANRVRNADGPETWYTDPFGRNGRTEPFPGSVRQRIGTSDNDIGVDVNGPVIGGGRDYGGQGVHAPN
jgi:hypothetical protein